MQWERLLSNQRLTGAGCLSPSEDPHRSPYHKDQDKILFSNAFRRLDKKTQAQPFPINDHAHSRLTHSLEVSCVGRSLGTRVGYHLKSELPASITAQDVGAIVQAACLAHDIGNPPFGHTGEDAIRQWFTQEEQAHYCTELSVEERLDFKAFEGNAQGFRVLTQLEYRRLEGGMQLTLASLGTFLKYPWTVKHLQKHKFGCYQTEKAILNTVAIQLGLIPQETEKWSRHPLAYLTEAADDICYALLDLEDGVEMGLIRQQEVEEVLESICPKVFQAFKPSGSSENQKLSLLRGPVFEYLVDEVVRAFIKHGSSLLQGQFENDIISACASHVSKGIQQAKKIAHTQLFQNPQKMTVEIGAYATMSALLDLFIGAVDEFFKSSNISYKHNRAIKMLGNYAPTYEDSRYQAYMKTIDYISGMTDQFAIHLAQNVKGLRY